MKVVSYKKEYCCFEKIKSRYVNFLLLEDGSVSEMTDDEYFKF